jgi:predicted ABC-type ATPase
VKKPKPRCIIIAGPNGAGKTMFAKSYLLQFAGIENFINADFIAAGLSPLIPERASRAAGRILLEELERLTAAEESFSLESTLSGPRISSCSSGGKFSDIGSRSCS